MDETQAIPAEAEEEDEAEEPIVHMLHLPLKEDMPNYKGMYMTGKVPRTAVNSSRPPRKSSCASYDL